MKNEQKKAISRARNKGDIASRLNLIACFRQLFEAKVSTVDKHQRKEVYNYLCLELFEQVFKSKTSPAEIAEYFQNVSIQAFQESCLKVPQKYFAIQTAKYTGNEAALKVFEPFFLEIIERSNIPSEHRDDAYNSLVLELLVILDQVSKYEQTEEKAVCFMLLMAPEIAISGTMVPTDHSIKGKMCNIEVDDTGSVFIGVTA
jgi:hypothetical protein